MEQVKKAMKLYLVTDSTPAILGNRDLVDVVGKALAGGVTCVQLRVKSGETKDIIETAEKLHALTKQYNVPLLIDDRVDVALAVGCEGVHIGQQDMDVRTARKLLGKDAIIGVTVNCVEQACIATEHGADYLGIGTVFSTQTKDTKAIIGPRGVREILEKLSTLRRDVATVAIGGIKHSNVQRVLHQSRSTSKSLDGVAIVSAIVAAEDPKNASAEFLNLIASPPPFAPLSTCPKASDVDALLERVPKIVTKLSEVNPTSHNMTNFVVQNFSANIVIAAGASPIMSNAGAEAFELSRFGGLLINMGTVTDELLKNYLQALQAYNTRGSPVVFDPVGAGASQLRKTTASQLLGGGYFDVIKGNEGEINTIAGVEKTKSKGVDSGESTTTEEEKLELVKTLAARERSVVLMTGEVDYLSDGDRTYSIANGHEYLKCITGSGCSLGSVIAAFLAVSRQDALVGTLAAVLMFEIAAEHAAVRSDVRGPGTFVPAFIDELHAVKQQNLSGNYDWLASARVTKF